MINSTKILILLSLLIFSCAKLEQNYPVRNFYVIDAQRSSSKALYTSKKTLEINRFNISPKYSGREFVYKVSENKYVSDFYNQFFKSPETLLNSETYGWLTESGIFKNVISGSIEVETDYILDANISDIYVDIRNPGDTKSILSIQFFITEETPTDTKLIFNKNYREEITAEDRSAESFVKGWNTALESILTSLENDIEKLEL